GIERTAPRAASGRPLLGQRLQVGSRHQPDQLLERGPRLPAEVALGLLRGADQMIHLRWPDESRIDLDVALEVLQAGLVEGDAATIADGMRDPRRDHVVLGNVSLE